uniref:Akirin-2 n=1 Tax=Lepeophtheirus salmonis TaxID=72036 RepID=D3PIL3_LEPSM|nr:Akirin-2 [Lepeophtheirus salmonis]
MACVTLKRPCDFDPLHSPNRPPTKRPRRCLPMPRQSLETSSSLMASPSSRECNSVFRESPLSAGEIANNLRDELKRLKRRRQLAPSEQQSMMEPQSPSSLSNTPSSPSAPSSPREKPIFTLKQMTLICERMYKERTDQVREEYDKILHQKLTEQYDAFVKFVDHQIQQRFNDSQTPSYLS